MDIYRVVRDGQDDVLETLTRLLAAPPARRRDALARLREELRAQERSASVLYDALLHRGVDPAHILPALESLAAVDELLAQMEEEAPRIRCWLGAVTLLRCLVREHFDDQEAPLCEGLVNLSQSELELIGARHQRERAAEQDADIAFLALLDELTPPGALPADDLVLAPQLGGGLVGRRLVD